MDYIEDQSSSGSESGESTASAEMPPVIEDSSESVTAPTPSPARDVENPLPPSMQLIQLKMRKFEDEIEGIIRGHANGEIIEESFDDDGVAQDLKYDLGARKGKSRSTRDSDLSMSTSQSRKETGNSARAYYDAEIHALKEKVKDLEGRSTSTRGATIEVGETASRSGSEQASQLTLDRDTFTMMMTSKVCSWSYWVGLITLIGVQGLGSYIAAVQANDQDLKYTLNLPYDTKNGVRVVQFFSLFLILVLQSNNLSALQTMVMLSSGGRSRLIGLERYNCWTWFSRVGLPNIWKLGYGNMYIYISFVAVIQSTSVLGLALDLLIITVVSKIPNIVFYFAHLGHLGRRNETSAREVEVVRQTSASEIEEKRSTCDKCAAWINLIVAVVVFASLLGGWIPFVVAQANGTIFKSYYPNCPHHDLKELFGDGECYGGPLLTPECDFENGDCLNLHNKYPLCNFTEVLHPNEEYDNGICNPLLNSLECGWDGRDCIPKMYPLCTGIVPETLGDGKCDAANDRRECAFDAGDCSSPMPSVSPYPSVQPSKSPSVQPSKSSKPTLTLLDAQLQIRFDSYPEETAWKVFDVNDNMKVVGERAFGYYTESKAFVKEDAKLRRCVLYRLTFYDSKGDGFEKSNGWAGFLINGKWGDGEEQWFQKNWGFNVTRDFNTPC
jgi:hypothetical protein